MEEKLVRKIFSIVLIVLFIEVEFVMSMNADEIQYKEKNNSWKCDKIKQEIDNISINMIYHSKMLGNHHDCFKVALVDLGFSWSKDKFYPPFICWPVHISNEHGVPFSIIAIGGSESPFVSFSDRDAIIINFNALLFIGMAHKYMNSYGDWYVELSGVAFEGSYRVFTWPDIMFQEDL